MTRVPDGPADNVIVALFVDDKSKDPDILKSFRPLPGSQVAISFPGFCVLVTHDGAALVLPSNMRKPWEPGHDRLIMQFKVGANGEGSDDEKIKRIADASLAIWPKSEVP